MPHLVSLGWYPVILVRLRSRLQKKIALAYGTIAYLMRLYYRTLVSCVFHLSPSTNLRYGLMAQELWSYRWHVFSAISALVSGECGYRKLFEELEKASPGKRKRLLKDCQAWSEDGDPLLIRLIRKIIFDYNWSTHGTPGRYDSSWGKLPWKLNLKIRKMQGDRQKEIIITPEALILAWPFPLRLIDGDPYEELLAELDQQVGNDIPPLDDEEYRADRDLLWNSCFTVGDVLITEKQIPLPLGEPAPEPEVSAEEVRYYKGQVKRNPAPVEISNFDAVFPRLYKEWNGFIVPSTLRITTHDTWRTTETRLAAEQEGDEKVLHVHLGMDVQDTTDIQGFARLPGRSQDVFKRANPHAFGALGPCMEGYYNTAPLHRRPLSNS